LEVFKLSAIIEEQTMTERTLTHLSRRRKQSPHKDLCTASEAIELLGIPQTTFFSLANADILHRVTPEGYREGYYVRDEILNYKRNLAALAEPYKNARLDFGLALNEDIPGIYQITSNVSGGPAHAVPEDVLKSWIRREPQSVHILRKGSEVLAQVSMFALEQNTLMERLSGKLLNRSIPVNDIVRFTPGIEISLYVAEMAVKHTDDYLQNNEPIVGKHDPLAAYLGARLIRETYRFLSSLRTQGITIKKLYAVGTSQFGIKMCRHLRMTPMDLPTGVREDRVPFEIDLSQSNDGSKLIERMRVS
jgi:hypothetical protein